eukprot:scaffold491891_cov14-Prasinocladus_malaysianus.AAC.1
MRIKEKNQKKQERKFKGIKMYSSVMHSFRPLVKGCKQRHLNIRHLMIRPGGSSNANFTARC